MQDRFDHWIFDSFRLSPEGLALYRIAFALFTLLFIAPGHTAYTDFARIATLPASFFVPPPGPMMLFSGVPPAWVFEGLQFLLNLSLAAVLFGFHTRWASVLTGVLFLVGYGFSYSFGKINHNILFCLVPLVMTLSDWGRALSFDALRQGRSAASEAASWPLLLLALLVGFGMFTAGLPKVIGGWLDPSTHATLGHLINQYFAHGRQDLLAAAFLRIESHLFWEGLDYATVLLELGFLLALLHPKAIRLFAAAAVLFHTGTLLMLNIAFTFHLIVYAAFLDWDRMWALRRPRPASSAPPLLRRSSLQAGLCLGAGLLFTLAGSPLLLVDRLFPFRSDLEARDLVAHALALACLLGAALLTRRDFTRSRRRASAPLSERDTHR